MRVRNPGRTHRRGIDPYLTRPDHLLHLEQAGDGSGLDTDGTGHVVLLRCGAYDMETPARVDV